MSSQKKYFLVLTLFLTLLLAGCNCTNAAVSVYDVLLDSPKDYAILSYFDFAWHGSDSCEPDEFKIKIQENIPWGGDSKYETLDGDESTHTFPIGFLLPGREYRWSMQAWNEYDPEESGTYYGPESDWEYFLTGPVCGSGALVAPELEVPLAYESHQATIDNWITHDGLQDFQWSYPGGCLPQFYDYEFATDTGFMDIVLSGTTTEDYSMHTYQTFPNCSTLFWRVRANHSGSVGPWSDIRQFHWVRKHTECYQTNYISDDAARIYVDLYSDSCSQTGYNASTTAITDSDCVADSTGNIIVGNGESAFPPDSIMWDYEVELGSGPCPSTGLDVKKDKKLPFHVVAPGTYCVSITREQSVGAGSVDLMDGVWSEPRTSDVIAYQTVEIPPLTTDVTVEFGWDEYDLVFLMPEFEFTLECRFCPDPLGPVTGFLFAGNPVPVYGRDYQSNWKLSEVGGMPCYALIPDALLDETLAMMGNMELRSLNLEQYPTPLPCPEPDKPSPGRPLTCSDYTTRDACLAHSSDGCVWAYFGSGGACFGP